MPPRSLRGLPFRQSTGRLFNAAELRESLERGEARKSKAAEKRARKAAKRAELQKDIDTECECGFTPPCEECQP